MTPALLIVSMGPEHLNAAAGLLAARQRRLRLARPELPADFEQGETHRAALQALMERAGAYGAVAERGNKTIGFLLGYPRAEPIWGRACWSPIEGSALADGADPELMRDLYAAWSSHFVGRGYFLQYVHSAADDPDLAAAWFRTGFGAMQAHAMRDVDTPQPRLPRGVHLRRAGPADIDGIDDLLPLIPDALAAPPAYAIRLPEQVATHQALWAAELGEPSAHHWLAEEEGRALALATFYPADPGPMVPDGAWELSVAMTRPEMRGRGLMRGLVAAGFREAREAGASHCITDWRTASLPTHRSWTALGFRPTHHRLHRHLDERIAWADGRRV